jgi:hypothetical protein
MKKRMTWCLENDACIFIFLKRNDTGFKEMRAVTRTKRLAFVLTSRPRHINTLDWRKPREKSSIVSQIWPKLPHQHNILLTREQNNVSKNGINLF